MKSKFSLAALALAGAMLAVPVSAEAHWDKQWWSWEKQWWGRKDCMWWWRGHDDHAKKVHKKKRWKKSKKTPKA
jgi:hypothetical protein